MKEETLHQKLSASAITVLISEELNHDQMNSIDIQSEGFGLEWWDDHSVGHLKASDRVLELNKIDVFKITNQGWDEVKQKLSDPVQAVFMRKKEHHGGSLSNTIERKRMAELRSDIAQIQRRLRQKLVKGKTTFKALEVTTKERDSLRT
jgi:hypothetical protein